MRVNTFPNRLTNQAFGIHQYFSSTHHFFSHALWNDEYSVFIAQHIIAGSNSNVTDTNRLLLKSPSIPKEYRALRSLPQYVLHDAGVTTA